MVFHAYEDLKDMPKHYVDSAKAIMQRWDRSCLLVHLSLGSDLRLVVSQLITQFCKLGLAQSPTLLQFLLERLVQFSCQPINMILNTLHQHANRPGMFGSKQRQAIRARTYRLQDG